MRGVERPTKERCQQMLAILAEKREAVEKAILTILLGKASTYGDYGDCNYEDRVNNRLLDEGEFGKAMAAVYTASDVVLDEHIERSMKVMDSAYPTPTGVGGQWSVVGGRWLGVGGP